MSPDVAVIAAESMNKLNYWNVQQESTDIKAIVRGEVSCSARGIISAVDNRIICLCVRYPQLPQPGQSLPGMRVQK